MDTLKMPLLLLAALIGGAMPAYAAGLPLDAGPVVIQQAADTWTPIVIAVVGALVGAVLRWNNSRDQATAHNKAMIDQLGTGLESALGAMQQATAQTQAQARSAYPMVPGNVAVGLVYLQNHAGEAVAHFFGDQGAGGTLVAATADHLAEKLTAKVGVKSIESNVASAMPTAPLAPTLPAIAPAAA